MERTNKTNDHVCLQHPPPTLFIFTVSVRQTWKCQAEEEMMEARAQVQIVQVPVPLSTFAMIISFRRSLYGLGMPPSKNPFHKGILAWS